MATVPPPPARSLPLYLTIAIFLAISFGMVGSCRGASVMGFYLAKTDPVLPEPVGGTPDDRETYRRAGEQSLAARNAIRRYAFPLGVADFLVGSALVLFAMRAFARRNHARMAMLQLLAVQAGLQVASHIVWRDTWSATVDFRIAQERVQARASPRALGDPRVLHTWFRYEQYLELGATTAGRLLLLVALTRARAKEVLDVVDEEGSEA